MDHGADGARVTRVRINPAKTSSISTQNPIMSGPSRPKRSPAGRPVLDTVNILIERSLIITLSREAQRDIVEPRRLKGVGPSARVHSNVICDLERDGYYFIVLEVKGVPEGKEILIEGRFRKRLRDYNKASTVMRFGPFEDWAPTAALSGNGRLASFIFEYTQEIEGKVTVLDASDPTDASGLHCRRLNTLRERGAFWDVVLSLGSHKFAAHKVILSAGSEVFFTMFSGSFKEATEKQVKITGDYSAAAFEKFLEYMYKGVLSDSSYEELVELLDLSCFYVVESLKKECERRFLRVGASDVLTVLEAVFKKPCIPEEIHVMATRVALDNWDAVVKSPEWNAFQKTYPHATLMLRSFLKLRGSRN